MKLISAILMHTWLVLRLKHDGTGLPTKLPAACVLTILYVTLTLANKHISQGITLETLLGLGFVGQIYLICLRTQLIGLFIVIGIITNLLTLILTLLFGIPEDKLTMLLIAEYILVFAAIVNFIKSNLKVI